MNIAELKVLLGFDAATYKAGMKEATGLTSSFQKSISGIGGMLAGAFSAGALIAYGKHLMNTAHEMEQTAEATNLTMGKVAALKTLFAESGLGADVMAMALGRIRDAQGQVLALSPAMEKALAALTINAKDFVGAGTDDALAMVAHGFVAAGGSAAAFSAVRDILGKNSVHMIEMLKNLDKTGLQPLIDRTKEAAQGFEDLADAEKTIDSFFNSIEIHAAKSIKLMDAFAKAWDNPTGTNMLDDWAAEFYKGKFGTDLGFTGKRLGAPKGNGGEPDAQAQETLAWNQYQKDLKDSVAKQKDTESKRKSDLHRLWAAEDEARAFKKMQRDKEEKIADLQEPGKVKGLGATVDSIMRIGGQIGMSRPGLAIEDRAVKIQAETNQIMKEANKMLREYLEKLALDHLRDQQENNPYGK